MALPVHTLVCKVCVILLSCVPVTWSACPSGPATYCSSPSMQYLGISANLLLTGQTASSCRDYCLASPPCKAVTFISGPGACTLYNTNHLTAGTLIAKSSINYYYYVCGGAVCGSGEVTITTTTTPGPTTTTTSTTTQPTTTTTTSTTTTRPTTTTNAASTTTTTAATTSKATSPSTTHKQPGYTTTKASKGNGMTPQEFWVWLRDDPLWLTLIGMGLMIFIEFWIIMYLFCRLKQQQKYHDDADSDDDSD